MIQQSYSWAYIQRKLSLEKIHALQYSLQRYLQQPGYGHHLNVNQQINGWRRCGKALSHETEWNNAIRSNMVNLEIVKLSQVSQAERHIWYRW